eukprot:CAMPEP_0180531572 /NCGR_PEP_ID=MMETSP1036_2-20121128/62575_1 /TAXON_ID=632150 /ORGANISM="Azadinium spinosum, Strain 3D9" /LENGTH=58 /DNA_ID=CAMNT_0022545551 /DNA_START=11 /DNA_END=184 /DNA_ORIENTATION=-
MYKRCTKGCGDCLDFCSLDANPARGRGDNRAAGFCPMMGFCGFGPMMGFCSSDDTLEI